jgi:hypothetical protein
MVTVVGVDRAERSVDFKTPRGTLLSLDGKDFLEQYARSG